MFDDVRKKTYGALQVCHLRLCQPHRLILQLHINGSFPILCLINDNLSSIVDKKPPYLRIVSVHYLRSNGRTHKCTAFKKK
ncbi:hypothetical protein [Bacteroides finegoldii]|uniref:hypothetical protein n=1 Tax=Bacteroides finegoldii TaxID=338188 RepID=UPI0027B8D68F|nr:hypothetical protein [Bacteroides finegoldii]